MSEVDSDVMEVESDNLYLDDMYIGDSEVVYHDVTEQDDFIITGDPSYPDEPDFWAVVITKGEYKDWVVRFPNVILDKGELEFTYEVIYLPDGAEFVDLDVANYMSAVISEIVAELHGTEGQVYIDQDTGEQILDN